MLPSPRQQIKQVQQEEHRRHQGGKKSLSYANHRDPKLAHPADHERGRKSSVDEYDQPTTSGAHIGNGRKWSLRGDDMGTCNPHLPAVWP